MEWRTAKAEDLLLAKLARLGRRALRNARKRKSSAADLREELPAAARLHADLARPRGHRGHAGGRGERLHGDGGEHGAKAGEGDLAGQKLGAEMRGEIFRGALA